MAASKDRIVSRGRSMRLRVGLERSGSAEDIKVSCEMFANLFAHGCEMWAMRTLNVPMMFPCRSLCWMLRRENTFSEA